MRFFLLLLPATLISTFVFLVFGGLGACSMSDCLGSNDPSTEQKVFGAAYIFAASFPLSASATVFIAYMRNRNLRSIASVFVWTVILTVGALGIFQALTDPGDAFWAGIPMVAYSTLLAFFLLTSPKDSGS